MTRWIFYIIGIFGLIMAAVAVASIRSDIQLILAQSSALRYPMSLEPMRAVSDRRVAQVTICAPAQLLKSEFCITCAVKGEYWGAPACTLRGSLPATGDSCTRAGLSSGSGSPLPALSAVFSASSGSVSRPATNA